jgi:hypothetical protein
MNGKEDPFIWIDLFTAKITKEQCKCYWLGFCFYCLKDKKDVIGPWDKGQCSMWDYKKYFSFVPMLLF